MHMDIFNDDAFSAVTMTEALEDYEFKPDLLGSLGLFEDIPTATTSVSIERRGNTLSIIPTSLRGTPPWEGERDRRNLRSFETTRIAKGHTLQASEIQNLRAFGEESELEQMIAYMGRYARNLVSDVELTWENMMLGAVQGVVYDADGSVIYDWFDEWGIAKPAAISMDLDDPAIVVEIKARAVLRTLIQKSAGNWNADSYGMALCGDEFFDSLTGHKSVRETFLNTADAQLLNRAFGVRAARMKACSARPLRLRLAGSCSSTIAVSIASRMQRPTARNLRWASGAPKPGSSRSESPGLFSGRSLRAKASSPPTPSACRFIPC
ncbi:Phage major capsid protein E [Paracoccus solventivorans]|uniref:Phage major capsid protein E n=1 Tax=Paracoccus solventivorans TaxID=53463 RepID=A0A1M7CWN1_9RHOB|nr:major capsid protein [Paracoccus solventivorans]SHL71656.1 Phage major capsid protein E [Paracoccus solventivorans]